MAMAESRQTHSRSRAPRDPSGAREAIWAASKNRTAASQHGCGTPLLTVTPLQGTNLPHPAVLFVGGGRDEFKPWPPVAFQRCLSPGAERSRGAELSSRAAAFRQEGPVFASRGKSEIEHCSECGQSFLKLKRSILLH